MLYVTGLIAFCAAWLLPGHFFPWTAFQQEVLACAGAWLVALAVLVTVKDWPLRVPAVAIALVAIACIPMAQWVSGLVPYLSDALVPSAYLLGFVMMILTGMALSRSSRPFVGLLFLAFSVGAFASVGLSLAQWLRLGPYGFLEAILPGERLYANLVQPNQLASLLGLGAVGVVWAFESRRIGGVVAALALAFIAWGVTMTQSRVGWMSALLFGVMWALYRRRLALRLPAAAAAGGVAAFAAMVVLWSPINQFMYPATDVMGVEARLQPGLRWIHWQTLFDALLRSPWTGYGWLQIGRAQQAAVFDHPVTFEQLGASHNQLLDLLLWNGLPLGSLAIGLVVWWSVTRMLKCSTLNAWAMLTGLGLLFAHSVVEFPLHYAYFLLPAGLMVGVVEADYPRPAHVQRTEPRLGQGTFAVVCIAMAALLTVVVREYLDVEEQVRRVRLREMGVVEKSDFRAKVPDVLLLDAPREYVRMWVRDEFRPLPPEDLAWLRTVSRRYPTPPALTRYAVASALSGHPEEAKWALGILCRIQLARHCDQARSKWAELGKEHPELAAIPFPASGWTPG